MHQVTGTYRDGMIIPDQPVDWPEGVHVKLTIMSPGQGDTCVDGSPWDDSPEGNEEWQKWFDSLVPVFTEKESSQFEAALLEHREQDKKRLPDWEKRVFEHHAPK